MYYSIPKIVEGGGGDGGNGVTFWWGLGGERNKEELTCATEERAVE